MPGKKQWRPFPSRLRTNILMLTLVAILHLSWTLSIPNSSPLESEEKAPSESTTIAGLHAANNTAVLRHPNFKVDFPLCLVHVGKAAGSSVSCGLGLTYADCEGMPRDRLPHTHFFHMRRQMCPKNTQTYVVTLRNPLNRLQSWFNFEKNIVPMRSKNSQAQDQARIQRAMLFQECYPTFEKLVLEGLQPLGRDITATQTQDMTCPERAWAAVLGIRPFSYHEWYNYEYYWLGIQSSNLGFLNKTHGNPVVYALRTEYLAEDWKTLSMEPLFRPVNKRRENSSSNDTALSYASPNILLGDTHAREQLCRALCVEIQYYKNFLLAAQNLGETQRQASLQNLAIDCPLETSLQWRDCPDIPEFPKMSVPARQYRKEIKKRLFRLSTVGA